MRRPLFITKSTILVFLLVILFLFDRGEHQLHGILVFVLLVGYYLYAEHVLEVEQIRERGLLSVHIGLYLLLATLLVHVTTGDEESFYWFIYLFPVIAAASQLRLLATLLIAGASSLLFLGQVPQAMFLDPLKRVEELPELLVFCSLFFIVGVLVQHYASQQRTQLQRQKELNERLLDNQASLKESLARLELAEQSLRRQETLAELGEMSAGLAHEIRNPLGIISSSAQLLANGADLARPAATDLLNVIVEETRRLNSMVSDFLTFGRPPTPVLDRLNLGDELTRAVDHLQGLALQRGLVVRADLPETGVFASADADMLQQSLLNLLLNALDASQPGQTVTAKLSTTAAGHAEISVCDQGCGIPAEHLARIFTPFFTTKQHGTGLGLANASRLVESFGGQLLVQSTPGCGSTFTISLPAVE